MQREQVQSGSVSGNESETVRKLRVGIGVGSIESVRKSFSHITCASVLVHGVSANTCVSFSVVGAWALCLGRKVKL